MNSRIVIEVNTVESTIGVFIRGEHQLGRTVALSEQNRREVMRYISENKFSYTCEYDEETNALKLEHYHVYVDLNSVEPYDFIKKLD